MEVLSSFPSVLVEGSSFHWWYIIWSYWYPQEYVEIGGKVRHFVPKCAALRPAARCRLSSRPAPRDSAPFRHFPARSSKPATTTPPTVSRLTPSSTGSTGAKRVKRPPPAA